MKHDIRNEHELREYVRSVVGAIAPIDGERTKSCSRLIDDLGYDSLGLIELMMTLEHELELAEVDEQDAISIKLVVDVENLIVKSALSSESSVAL